MAKDNQKTKSLIRPILLILAASASAGIGQLFWKKGSFTLSANILSLLNIYIILGIFLYLCGTVFMILAFRHGELSVLHPFLATSYVWVVLVSALIFPSEILTYQKIIGAVVIFLGVSLIGLSSRRKNGN
ncbi:MAG: EamA/RhaT family transporter [Nanoarchaeota archaeon]|nr:EamA/RhaT family transporter [Nanoarchaeota archaeon]